MGIVVQKYGGKLVADKEKMKKVANIIAKSYDKGNKIVAVISAMGDTTDKLNEKIMEITDNPLKREADVVLASGEQIAIGLLSIMLNIMGYKAISLTGWQAGILTNNDYTDADIIKVDSKCILDYLNDNYIVIVAGFQGIDNNNNITTLGRGGSDTTATTLAANLKADVCEIYKDTKCIFTADPKEIQTAKKLDHINYKDMLELARMGAKVLSVKSIEYANRYKLNLLIKSIDDDDGTEISKQDNCNIYPLISCTKKKQNDDMDIITFILNTNYNEKINYEDIIKLIIKKNSINDYVINYKENKISVILNNKYSKSILTQIHDTFINMK